jgi:hypothetical protein
MQPSNAKRLKELHWLPMHARIDYKILLLMCRKGLAPGYLAAFKTSLKTFLFPM